MMDREATASRVSDIGGEHDDLADETMKSESKSEMEATEVSEEISSPEVDVQDDAVVSHRAAFVVGEDSESEEDEEEEDDDEEDEVESVPVDGSHWAVTDMIDDIGDAEDLLDEDDEENLLPNHRPLVFEGEASESSDDDDADDKNEKEDYVEQPQRIQYTNVMIPKEKAPTPNGPSSTSSQPPTTNKASKADSVLHHKLRETNDQLKDAIETQWQKMLKSAAKDLSAIGHGFQRTRQVTQDTSHSMRTLTNNLFKIEDSIDIVANCDILPNIYLK